MPILPLQTDPEHRKLLPEEFVALAEDTVRRGNMIVFANDIDLTLALADKDDPRETILYPKAAHALRELEKHGQIIGLNSNRDGSQIALMTEKAGLRNPYIVGSYGLERFTKIDGYPRGGIATIDDRFQPYIKPITEILHTMRLEIQQTVGVPVKGTQDAYSEIPTAFGTIILERKGICDDFPEGIAAGYNLNLVEPHYRSKIVALMEETYRTLLFNALKRNPLETIALQHVWNVQHDKQSPELPGRYSFKIEPNGTSLRPKRFGTANLLRRIREDLGNDQMIGLIVVAGDDEADAEAMWEAQHITFSHNKDLLDKPVQTIGIWVNPGIEHRHVSQQADIIIDGVIGYAELLTATADLIAQYHTKN